MCDLVLLLLMVGSHKYKEFILVCICMFICKCIYVCMNVKEYIASVSLYLDMAMHVVISIYTTTHIPMYIEMFINVYIRINRCTHPYVHISICMYVYIYVCIDTYVYKCVFSYTCVSMNV
jgi:hypothetical protein